MNILITRLLLFCIGLFSSFSYGFGPVSIDRNTNAEYPNPPPYREKAETARYIAHYSDWGVVGTISTMPNISGRPFTNIISFCDGPLDNSTGTPYFYVMDEDASMKDIKQNPLISLSMSEKMFSYCQTNHLDPEDPRCARLTLGGKMVSVASSEKRFALDCLFARHPAMKGWSIAHKFYPTKLEIETVWLIDFFGGASIIPVKEYYAVKL